MRRLLDEAEPAADPYEEFEPKLAAALRDENQACAAAVTIEAEAGRFTVGGPMTWDEIAAADEAEDRALVEDGWHEIARRERRTFGMPRPATLDRLRGRLLASCTRRVERPTNMGRRRWRHSSTQRARSRDPDGDPEPALSRLLASHGGGGCMSRVAADGRGSVTPTGLAVHISQPWPAGRYKRYRQRNGCVRNAMMLFLDHPDELRVAKGYALPDDLVDFWVGHWWCVDDDGRVVDPTWKNTGLAYVAVEIVDPEAYWRRIGSHWELELDHIAGPELVAQLEHAEDERRAAAA